ARRLPEDVVLEDAHAVVAGELRCETARPLRAHLCRDDRVGLPRIAELARSVFRITARNPVHLVGPNPGLVLALEQLHVALLQQLEPTLGDEPFLDDEETVVPDRLDLLRRERLDHGRRLLPQRARSDVREHPRPHALEDVVACTRNHLDATAEAVLPPGRALLPAVPRSVEEERLRAHHPWLGAIERWRRDEGEPFDEAPVRRGQLNGLP